MQLNKEDKRNGRHTKRIETHIHTSEGSPCGKVSVQDTVKLYANAGYDVMIVTNHFNRDTVPKAGLSDREAVDYYVDIYKRACEYGQQLGIDVWFGIETNIVGGKEDFLLYGADPQILYENPRMYDMTQEELFAECVQFGCLLYQAHPFRNGCFPRNPELLHGAEAYNGHPRQINNNEEALAWITKNELRSSSGSDFHRVQDVGRGGILVPEYVNDIKALADYMRKNELTLIMS